LTDRLLARRPEGNALQDVFPCSPGKKAVPFWSRLFLGPYHSEHERFAHADERFVGGDEIASERFQKGCNVATNTAININVTDNTATKIAASESSKPNGRLRIGASRH